jgi:hypothetical protein
MIKKNYSKYLFVSLSLVSLLKKVLSPHSYYGIGDVRFSGQLKNRSMAGVVVEQAYLSILCNLPC